MFMQRKRKVRLLAAVIPAFLALLVISGCSRDPNVRKRKYLESGKRYETDAKYKEAMIQFSNALKIDKNCSEAHYEMAKTYLRMGAIKASYGELMRVVELSPNNLQARIDLGDLLLAGNATDRAEEQAKAVIAADPNDADAYALLATIAARKGDHAGALSNIQHAVSIEPKRAAFHTTLALIQASDPVTAGSAVQELQQAIALDPKDSHAHMVMSALLERKGDMAGAEQQLETAIQNAPNDLQVRSGLAGLYLHAGDKGKAEQTMRKAVEDLPNEERASELLKDFYIQTGQPGPAETTFAELVAKYPKSYPIKLNYGIILAAKQEYDKLSPLVDQLIKSNASQPQVQLLKSTLQLSQNKVNDAAATLQAAAKSSPENAQLQIALGKVALMKGDVNLAQASFDAAEKEVPTNVEVLAGQADIATRKNDPNMLMQVAEKAIGLRPDFALAYLWRGTAEAALKQNDKAEADFNMVIAKNPNAPQPYIELGQLKLSQSKFPEGVAQMEKALDKDPRSVPALRQIVAVNLFQKQPDKALARVQQQIVKAPGNEPFYTLLAQLQMNTKDYAGARDNAKKAMDMNAADGAAVQTYAQALVNLGNIDDALHTWQNWQTSHPTDANATTMLALMQEQKGLTGPAIENYKKALSIDPEQGQAANNLAYLMVTSGQNLDVALSYAQTARRVLKDAPSTADTLAWVYYNKGTYYSARDLLEDAVKAEPSNAAMHYHLGMTYSKLGRKSDAVLELKKAVSLAPNSSTAKDATTALGQLG